MDQDQFNRALSKIKKRASDALAKKKYEIALELYASYSRMQYEVNQIYADDEVEDDLYAISKHFIEKNSMYAEDPNCVLFYDGFGLDLRGWALSYVRAITSLGYKLIYVCPQNAVERIPHIEKEIAKGSSSIIEIVDTAANYIRWIDQLHLIFEKYRPANAFFYTTPSDVAGIVVFNGYEGRVRRIFIDLTDHAFWIGKRSADRFIEGRILGASNAIFGRGINREKISKLDCCLYINRDENSTQMPFELKKTPFFFSGGSLYKTLGDAELQYYGMLDGILSKHQDIKFIYAGCGDDSEMKKIIEKFPGRAFLIPEIPDFFSLFENCIFYLNTYPMFGGVMMRYAAYAGKIPLTLKHDKDHEGILFDQEKRGIEFDTADGLLHEADRLIIDADYRKSREDDMAGSVLSERDFEKNIKNLLDGLDTLYSFGRIEEIDTVNFRREYINRADFSEIFMNSIAVRINKWLLPIYPGIFLKKAVRRLKK